MFYNFGQACKLSKRQPSGILDENEAIVDVNVQVCITSFKKLGVLKANADREKVVRKIKRNFASGLGQGGGGRRERIMKKGGYFARRKLERAEERARTAENAV